MGQDSIVDEVRKVRDAYARRFNYDLKAIHRDLKGKEGKGGRKTVSFAPKLVKAVERLTR